MSNEKIISICKGCDTIYDNDKEHTKPCCPDMNYKDWVLEEYANQQTQELQRQVESLQGSLLDVTRKAIELKEAADEMARLILITSNDTATVNAARFYNKQLTNKP